MEKSKRERGEATSSCRLAREKRVGRKGKAGKVEGKGGKAGKQAREKSAKKKKKRKVKNEEGGHEQAEEAKEKPREPSPDWREQTKGRTNWKPNEERTTTSEEGASKAQGDGKRPGRKASGEARARRK